MKVPATSPPAQNAFSPAPFMMIVFAKSEFSHVYTLVSPLSFSGPLIWAKSSESSKDSDY
jgi:hypothetical protein